MKTILIPFDFSKYAKNALSFAIGLSKTSNAQLHLLHVVEPLGGESFDAFADGYSGSKMDDVFMLKLIEKTKKDLVKLKQKYADVQLEVHLRMGGSIHETIAEYARKLKADVIVMGTLGHGSVSNQLVGSNAQKVVRLAPCSVISVTEGVKAGITNLIFASDFQKMNKKAMETVKAYQQLFGAKLHLLRVCTPTNFENTSVLTATMEKVVKDHALKNVTINQFNDFFIEDGILNFSSAFKDAMICLTTEGRTGFARILTHSIAEDVVNYANNPVLTMNLKNIK